MTTKIKKRRSLPTATYIEKSDRSNKKAMGTLILGGIKDFDTGIAEIQEGTKSWVRGCNRIREAGRKFIEAEDLNQREFKSWHFDVDDWKKEQMRRAKIDAAKKVFRQMDKPAKKFEDCKPVIQIALIAAGDIQGPKRLEQHVAHEAPNPWTEITEKVSVLESIVKDIEDKEPMNEWNVDKLEKFIRVTKPLVEKYEAAEKLLHDRR